MRITIHGSDLPGRSCGGAECGPYDNIHVGIRYGRQVIELVPGDASSARWDLEVKVRTLDDGSFDFTGPYVYGRRGERALGLPWGTVDGNGTFTVFRAAKLRMEDIDSALVEEGLDSQRGLVARLGLTDGNGWPICASVRPPAVNWSLARS